jgi:hypothetical protein
LYLGHYGIGLALKKYVKGLSLGWLFLATQFVDILATIFAILGIERANVVPGFTPSSSIEYVYFPFSHSLAAFLVWTGVFYVIFRLVQIRPELKKSKVAIIMALGVLSHFVLDFIVHTSDMPIFFDNSYKLGLGLWNFSPVINYILEASILLVGLFIYMKATKSSNLIGKYGIVGLTAILLVINAILMSGQVLLKLQSFAFLYLIVNLSIVFSAFWIDKRRY